MVVAGAAIVDATVNTLRLSLQDEDSDKGASTLRPGS
jgi:hypothetical protein